MVSGLGEAQHQQKVTERPWGFGAGSEQLCLVSLKGNDRQGMGEELGSIYRGGVMEDECPTY